MRALTFQPDNMLGSCGNGFIPSFTDWVKAIRPEAWMGRTEKIEALVDPQLTPPVVEVR